MVARALGVEEAKQSIARYLAQLHPVIHLNDLAPI